MSTKTLRGVVILGLLLASVNPAAAADPDLASGCAPSVPPDTWSLRQIAAEAAPQLEGDSVLLLAWEVREDDRPLRVESALVMRIAGDQSFLLEHLYRHPDDDPPRWSPAMTHVTPDSDEPGHMIFHQESWQRRPSNAELYAALGFEQVNWDFELEEGWRRLGGGVCEANWMAATGERPTRTFDAGDAKPGPAAVGRLDHILVGARDLDQARRWFEDQTGVGAVYGGKHPAGTHNALAALGGGVYLELIAPQPGADAASRYGDFTALTTPQPIGFAVAGDDVARLRDELTRAGFATTPPTPGSRLTPAGATLRWQTFALDPEVEQAPFFIVWGAGTPHPATTSPAGCSLRRLAVTGPAQAGLERLRAALGLDIEVARGERPSFTIELDCPKGRVTLRTPEPPLSSSRPSP